MEKVVKDEELDKLVRKCYQCVLKSDINDIFIIYEDQDEVVEIPYDVKVRLRAIDKILSYFEKFEEYEMCHELVLIKQKAQEFGKQNIKKGKAT
jgi:hypothetical protein